MRVQVRCIVRPCVCASDDRPLIRNGMPGYYDYNAGFGRKQGLFRIFGI